MMHWTDRMVCVRKKDNLQKPEVQVHCAHFGVLVLRARVRKHGDGDRDRALVRSPSYTLQNIFQVVHGGVRGALTQS